LTHPATRWRAGIGIKWPAGAWFKIKLVWLVMAFKRRPGDHRGIVGAKPSWWDDNLKSGRISFGL
jgi:hypothetical protein